MLICNYENASSQTYSLKHQFWALEHVSHGMSSLTYTSRSRTKEGRKTALLRAQKWPRRAIFAY